MVDFSLEKEQIEIREKVRDFADRYMRPNARKYDELATFPWDIVKQAYKEGLMNGPMDKKYGGQGHSIFESALSSEELGAGCVGIGICMDANTLALTPLYIGADEEQKKRFYQDNKTRKKLNKGEVEIDGKFLAALKEGLPECAGVAIGLDRLLMVLCDVESIAEVQAFSVGRN